MYWTFEGGIVISDERAAYVKKVTFDLSLERYIVFEQIEKYEQNVFPFMRPRELDEQRLE